MFAIGTAGDLNEKYPALILGWSTISRFSGLVKFNQGNKERKFYFLKGKIIATGSNQPTEGAIAVLVRQKLVSNENYKKIYQAAYQENKQPEELASTYLGIMGGQLREAQIIASRLLLKNLAASLEPGNYTCTSGIKPPNGSILFDLDPLFDLICGLAEALNDSIAQNWFINHNLFLRLRPEVLNVFKPTLKNISTKIKSPINLPDWDIPPGPATDLIRKLNLSPRTLMLLLAISALVPSEARTNDPPMEKPGTPEERAMREEITAEYERIKELDHFALLGIAEDAKEEAIRNAYLELAQKWHTDRFGNLDLGLAAEKLQFIIAKINEAKEVLSDPKQNETYRFVLERQRQGLPTDVEIILKAEENFKKAQLCIDQSKYQMALPLLQEAVSLNKGEAEFWIALALSLVAVNGQAAYEEAMQDLDKADGMDSKLHKNILLTKGQIELMLQKYKEADKFYDEVLSIDPGNDKAQRDKRLITNRIAHKMAKESSQSKSLKELLTGKK